MAVAFGSEVHVTPGTGANTGASPSITTPATNPVVMVCVAISDATATVSSLTITGFGGTATEIKNVRTLSGAVVFVSIWAIVAPTASMSGTVQANISASVPYQMSVCAYSGAHQSTPCPTGDAVTSVLNTTPRTGTPTNLTVDDASVGIEANGEAQDLNAPTPNNRYLNNTTAVNAGVGDATGTTGVTFSTTGGSAYATVAVRIVAGAATRQWILMR